MKPHRVIAERDQSAPCRHKDVALTICEGEVKLEVVSSAVRAFESLVVLRCYACAKGSVVRAIEVTGVIPEGVKYWQDDAWDDDPDDCDTWQGGV